VDEMVGDAIGWTGATTMGVSIGWTGATPMGDTMKQ